jgi:hypothetical protein
MHLQSLEAILDGEDTAFLKFMSSLYVILFYNLFLTIWWKDNKLIIYLSKTQPRTVVSQLTRKDGTTTKEISEIVDCFFQELFPLAPSNGPLSIPPTPTEDTRWPKLKASEIEEALYQQSPYKTPGPDNIKTIATRKVWKVNSCRKVITRLFPKCVKIEYRPKVFREDQTVILRKPNKPKTLARSGAWYQERSWSGGQVLRLVTGISLLMVRLIRAACWGFTECQSLVSVYCVLCIAGFP